MKLFDKIGNIFGYFSLCLLMVVMCVAITIPVSANTEEEIHTEEFNSTVKQEEEAFQDASVEEVDEQIADLEAKYVQEQSKSDVTVARTFSAQSEQSYNNPQEYYSEEDLAKLEALNNVRADKIMEQGVAGGAKEENEAESSQPVEETKLARTPGPNNWSYYGWNGAGDIFISTFTTVPVVGDFGHAALGGDTENSTIEAPGNGYNVQWKYGAWFQKLPDGRLRAIPDNGAWAWYRVYSASLQKYQDAKNYAHNKILGAPYNLKFYGYANVWRYHCGEVVHFAWLRGAGMLVSNSKDNAAIGPYGLGPQNKYGATYRYRGDLSSKGSNN